MAGRPTLCESPYTDRTLEAINEGLPQNLAIDYSGAGRSTVLHWLAQGRKDQEAGLDTVYADFQDRVKKARTKVALTTIKELKEKASKTNAWQADAWILERMYPREFGKDSEELNRLSKEIEEIKELLKEKNSG